jgi:hypothetical protein
MQLGMLMPKGVGVEKVSEKEIEKVVETEIELEKAQI